MKICIVSGATGTLGEEVSKKFKNLGYYVVGISRKKSNIADANICCDFNNFDFLMLKNELNLIFDKEKIDESIDFVHCMGYYQKEKKFNSRENYEICKNTFNVNVFSFYVITNILIDYCNEKGFSSSVVAVSSNLTIKANTFTAPYISSKFALEGLVKSFAQTYGYLNMRFNIVCPGMFASNMNGYFVPEQFEKNVPLKKIGGTSDIVDAILFFISSESSCITSNKLIIDGGGSNGY